MSRPENYKNTDYEYDLRSKGVGGFGSPSSKPPTQNGNNEDQDLNQMIEQLQAQLGEKNAGYVRKKSWWSGNSNNKDNTIIDFKKNWTKEKQKVNISS
jgi:hypothetical protein